MSQQVSLNYDGKEIDLPRIVGSEGEVGIDIAKLRAMSRISTANLASCDTGVIPSKSWLKNVISSKSVIC